MVLLWGFMQLLRMFFGFSRSCGAVMDEGSRAASIDTAARDSIGQVAAVGMGCW